MGRYLARIVKLGDDLDVAGVRGTIVWLHPASVEVLTADGVSVHLTNSQVFREGPRIQR